MATSREIKEKAIQSLIGIISDCVKRNGGKIVLKQKVHNGSSRVHNDTFERYISEVFDYNNSNQDAQYESESGIYYSEEYCYDAPIEELGFYQLFEIAYQCENIK